MHGWQCNAHWPHGKSCVGGANTDETDFLSCNRASARGHRQDVEWIVQARGSDATAKVGGAFLENENGRLLSHYSCHHTSRIR